MSDNFILKGVISFLDDVISYLNPFSDNFFGLKIVELLSNVLQFLFIPSQDRITAITNTVSNKFGFIDTIKIAINSLYNIINNVGESPKLSLDLGATKYTNAGNYVILDLSWYSQFKPYGDIVLTGFIYLFFIWRFFVHLPNIINATGGVSDVIISGKDKGGY